MKIEIIKAVSKTKIETETVIADLPDEDVYYEWNDEGTFFSEGLVLFAIIPKYKNSHNYLLVQVSRNKQDYTDFHPRSDCRDSYFLDYKGLRNRALDILTNKNTDFKLISKEDFYLKRMTLLNQYQNI